MLGTKRNYGVKKKLTAQKFWFVNNWLEYLERARGKKLLYQGSACYCKLVGILSTAKQGWIQINSNSTRSGPFSTKLTGGGGGLNITMSLLCSLPYFDWNRSQLPTHPCGSCRTPPPPTPQPVKHVFLSRWPSRTELNDNKYARRIMNEFISCMNL